MKKSNQKTSAKIQQLEQEASVDPKDQTLTTSLGVPVCDNQNSLKVGERGPTLLEDFLLRDKLIHFDRERIPERVVHAVALAHTAILKRMKAMHNGPKLSS